MSEHVFKTKKAVREYLISDEGGYTISQSQFYKHCAEGLLRPRKSDGQYTLKAVKKYASLHVKKKETGQKESEWEEKIRREKAELGLEQARVEFESSQINLEKKKSKLVPRDEFEPAVVARSVAFMAHLNHTVHESAVKWVKLVKGDPALAPQLVDAISRAIEQRMGDFAIDAEFDIILEVDE